MGGCASPGIASVLFPEAFGVPWEPQDLAASCTCWDGRDAHRSRDSLLYGLLSPKNLVF